MNERRYANKQFVPRMEMLRVTLDMHSGYPKRLKRKDNAIKVLDTDNFAVFLLHVKNDILTFRATRSSCRPIEFVVKRGAELKLLHAHFAKVATMHDYLSSNLGELTAVVEDAPWEWLVVWNNQDHLSTDANWKDTFGYTGLAELTDTLRKHGRTVPKLLLYLYIEADFERNCVAVKENTLKLMHSLVEE